MKINFNTLASLLEVFNGLQTIKVPFKLGLILAKNTALLKKEEEFYVEQEREFALKYLEVNEETGEFVTQGEGIYKIKDGLEEECRAAREALNNFECEVDLRMIPVTLIENMEFTPAQLSALECVIEEE